MSAKKAKGGGGSSGEAREVRSVTRNKKVLHEFHVLDEVECGISLRGTEVKSLRAGRCSIAEAYGLFRGGELWLLAADIPEYAQGNIHNHPPKRERKLLLNRRELDAWRKQVREKGITLKATEVLFRGSLVKVRMALVRGKKLYDKRASERERSDKREIERAMTRRR